MEDIGVVRIEYKHNDNVIKLYNSPEVCSLVINGKIVDQYRGVIATRFVLKGKIEYDAKTIIVEAKMGFLFMRIYYDGKMVAKKFMGLG